MQFYNKLSRGRHMNLNLANQLLTTLSQKIPALVATIIAVCLASGCTTAPPFKAYEDSDLYDNELVLLDWSRCVAGCVYEIDGKKLPRDALFVTGRYPTEKAKLMPGKHTIRYGWGIYRKVATIDMQAGHLYDVMHKRDTSYGVRHYLWIVDITTGKVVHGDPF